MSATLDSVPVFVARAKQLGLTDAEIQPFQAAGIDTFAKLAYSSSYTPGSPDEQPFKDVVTSILGLGGGAPPSLAIMSVVRRLHLEAHTMSVQDVRSRLERTEDATPLRLLPAERASRFEDQKRRLAGLQLEGPLECSHSLIDAVCQQFEENVVKWLPWETLTSREQELAGMKKDKKVSELTARIENNKLVLEKKKDEAETDLHSDLRVRAAWSRRALAYDQANLISFTALEAWSELMVRKMQEEPPPGYARVTLAQCLAADKRIFQRMGEACRAGIQPHLSPAGVVRPLEQALQNWTNQTEILFMLQPLPSLRGQKNDDDVFNGRGKKGKGRGKGQGSPYDKTDRNKDPKQDSRQKGRGKGNRGSSQRSEALRRPEGCCSMTDDGRRLCFGFNDKGCKGAAIGAKCDKGWHLCGKKGCHGEHPMSACPSSSTVA